MGTESSRNGVQPERRKGRWSEGEGQRKLVSGAMPPPEKSPRRDMACGEFVLPFDAIDPDPGGPISADVEGLKADTSERYSETGRVDKCT